MTLKQYLIYSTSGGLLFMTVAATVVACVMQFNELHRKAFQLQSQNTDLKTQLQSMDEQHHIEMSLMSEHVEDLFHRMDVAEGRLDILDQAVTGHVKHKAKIDMTVAAIKESLPNWNNPFNGCTNKPSQGELRRIADAVVKSSEEYAVPIPLILGIIRQESVFCNQAVSPVGARGYMQIMPETAVEIALDVGKPLKTWRSRDNIEMGTIYIGQMLLEFDGNTDLAIRAYNGGPAHVKKVLAGMTKSHICDDGRETPYYCETDMYVDKVLQYKETYEKLGL